MADTFTVRTTPNLDAPIDALDRAARSLRDLSLILADARRSDRRRKRNAAWPLRRRSGRLRASLTWSGQGAGPRRNLQGREATRSPSDRNIFYARFSHFGTKHQRKRELLAVDESDTTARLQKWARSRVQSSGRFGGSLNYDRSTTADTRADT